MCKREYIRTSILNLSKDEDMAAVTDLLMGRKVRILVQGAE
jgi:hypothetical protein